MDLFVKCHLKLHVDVTFYIKKVKVAHTRLPSLGSPSWSRFLTVSLQVMWIINPTVGCRYFPPDLQLPPQPLRGLLPVLLLGEQRHNEWTICLILLPESRLRFEPGPFCAWVQQANHLATEPPTFYITLCFWAVHLSMHTSVPTCMHASMCAIWACVRACPGGDCQLLVSFSVLCCWFSRSSLIREETEKDR